MTIDKTRTKAPKGTLPQFTPVPRHYQRHDGWTPERQQNFIEALADTGSVRAAANSVNMTSEGAYHLRRHPQAGEFRKAWEAALALGVQKIEDVAMDRALNGVEVPVYHFGEVVGWRTVYNDYLLMFLLRNRAPKRFGADNARGMNAVDRQHVAKLKKEWRKQWERESAQEYYDRSHRRGEALTEVFDEQHRTWFLSLGPQARAAYRAFRLAVLEERKAGMDWIQKPGALAASEKEYREEYAFDADPHGRSRLQRIAETFLVMADEWENGGGEEARPALAGPVGGEEEVGESAAQAPDDEPELPKRPEPGIRRL